MEERFVNKSRYKVLPLPSPYKWEIDEEDLEDILNTGSVVTVPVFNRPGWYYDRIEKVSWVESKYGCFRDVSPTMFLYNLGIMNHRQIPNKVLSAIKVLENYNMCPRDLLKLMWKEAEVRDLRRISRDVWRHRYAFEKEWSRTPHLE